MGIEVAALALAAAKMAAVAGAGTAAAMGVQKMMGGSAGGGQMSYIKPPKELEAILGKQYERERGEIRQEGQFAKAGVGQKAVETGLGSTSYAGAMQTRIGKETEDRLLDLSQRYQMSRYGAYTPMVTGSPGLGPFESLLGGFGQMAGMSMGQQMFAPKVAQALAPSSMSAFAAGTPYQQGLSGSSLDPNAALQVASWYR